MNHRLKKLHTLIKEIGSQAALSRLTGVSTSQIGQYITGHRNIGERVARKLEETTRKPKGWFDSSEFLQGDNFSSLQSERKVPVISWISAGAFKEIEDFHPEGEADEWMSTEILVSDNAFGLVVNSDSMTNDAHPVGRRNVPRNTRIICDPCKAYNSGDLVVVKDVKEQTATFKKLAGEPGQYWLVALNPDQTLYPPTKIDDDKFRVIAKVTGWTQSGQL